MISVIVSNFNGLRFLPRLLESLRQQQEVETELVIVDRHSTDGSIPFLQSQTGVRLLSEPPETGLVAGYAAGAAIARGDLLFFCNEDMWFDPRCLRNLALQIDLPKRIGAVDGWHWTYDGREWLHGATRFKKSFWHLNSPYPFRSADFAVDLPAGSETPFPCAGAFLIHREMYEAIGGWDTSFFLDHEDVDLFLRAWQRQWRCVMAPDARIYHAVNASNGHILSATGRPASRRRYVGQRSNLVIIALKYFGWSSILTALLQWPFGVLNNLRAGHWNSLREDHAIPGDIFRRMSAAWAFRQANAPYNTRYSGEDFFTDARFAARPLDPAD